MLDYDGSFDGLNSPFRSSLSSSSVGWRRPPRLIGKVPRRSSLLPSTNRDSLDQAMDELKNIVSHISMQAPEL